MWTQVRCANISRKNVFFHFNKRKACTTLQWMKLLTLDDDVRVEGGDPLGRDGLLVRVEVVEVALGGDQAEAEGDQQHWEPHPDQITAHGKTEKRLIDLHFVLSFYNQNLMYCIDKWMSFSLGPRNWIKESWLWLYAQTISIIFEWVYCRIFSLFSEEFTFVLVWELRIFWLGHIYRVRNIWNKA